MKKKILCTVLAVVSLSATVSVSAQDLEVTVIEKPAAEVVETNLLEDVALELSYEIDEYATIKPLSFEFVDQFVQYENGNAGDNMVSADSKEVSVTEPVSYDTFINYCHVYWCNSGVDADYAWLSMDVTNLTKEDLKVMENAEVKVVYDDEYEFNGWVRQFNYEYDSTRKMEGKSGYGTLIRAAIEPVDEEPIEMLYTGHYVFGCTLPNAVVEGEEPLYMAINLNGNEITYYIRR